MSPKHGMYVERSLHHVLCVIAFISEPWLQLPCESITISSTAVIGRVLAAIGREILYCFLISIVLMHGMDM